jgi:hypothetical protein
MTSTLQILVLLLVVIAAVAVAAKRLQIPQINDLYRLGKLKDEARRRIERELDLREAQLTNAKWEE